VCSGLLFDIQLATSFISYDIDAILILEHSFYLAQHNDPKPVSSAILKYNEPSTAARVGKDLEDVFKQYNTVSVNEKVNMVFKVIIQNHIGESNIHIDIALIATSIPDTPTA
jgi:hypothetical protein